MWSTSREQNRYDYRVGRSKRSQRGVDLFDSNDRMLYFESQLIFTESHINFWNADHKCYANSATVKPSPLNCLSNAFTVQWLPMTVRLMGKHWTDFSTDTQLWFRAHILYFLHSMRLFYTRIPFTQTCHLNRR